MHTLYTKLTYLAVVGYWKKKYYCYKLGTHMSKEPRQVHQVKKWATKLIMNLSRLSCEYTVYTLEEQRQKEKKGYDSNF